MSRSTRLATLATATLVAFALPIGALPALASTEVVAAPLPAPTGLAPVDNPDVFPHTVRKDLVLHWNPVVGATSYRVEIGHDETWSDTVVKTYELTGTTYIVPVADLPYSTYAWRVAALRGSTLGHWTSESTNSQNRAEFTKGWRAAPTLIAPLGGGTLPAEFSWSNVGEGSRYQLQVSNSPITPTAPTANPDTTPTPQTQPSLLFTCETTRTRLAPFDVVTDPVTGASPALPGEAPCAFVPAPVTHYYWHVRAMDGSAAGPSEASNWSVQGDFITPAALVSGPLPAGHFAPYSFDDAVNPEPDGLCSVTRPNGTADKGLCTDVPTIRWAPAAGATRYEVTVAADDQLSNVLEHVSTSTNSWTTATSWPEGSASMSYYYDVQACNDTTCTPYTSTPRSFRKVSPRLSNLSQPAATGLALFTWGSYATALGAAEQTPSAASTASQDAATYHVQVATSAHPSYDATTLDVTVDGIVPTAGDFPGTTQPTYLADVLPDGQFVWRVQAVDGAGNKLPWSLSRAFTRDSTPPRLISVMPSSNVGVTAPLRLTFSEPVNGVATSSIVVSPAVGYTVAVTSSTTATLTPTSHWLPGATYTITPTSAVTDAVGNSAVTSGPSFTVNPLADDVSVAIGYTSGWRILSATNAVGGRFHETTPTSVSHPSATMAFRGTGVSLTSCLGPANGYVDVFVDGVRRARTSSYRSYSGCGIRLVSVTGLPRTAHTVKVMAVGIKVSVSRGYNVDLDALTVTP